MRELVHCPAVIALELPANHLPGRTCLDRAEAEQLAGLLAEDLARLVPSAAQAHLIIAAGLFDPAQLLRPDWPIFAEMAELGARAIPDDARPHVLAFGSHADVMPTPALQPDPIQAGAAMLLLPWMLCGDSACIDAIGIALERDLAVRGEVGARVADFLMRALDVRFEHARYLTRHDVCALTCVQLEHVGLSALWQMLETALLSPQAASRSVSTRGRQWEYRDGAAHCGTPDYSTWYREQGHALGSASRAHAYAGWLFELRQYAALLEAHRLPLRVHGSAAIGQAIETLDPLDAAAQAPLLVAHEAPGLGIVVLRVVQSTGTTVRVLAQAFPLRADELDGLRAEFARRYGAIELRRLGSIVLDSSATELDPYAGCVM
ncbi:MAG: hypothetical protein ABI411_15935 [Tahibacter sp.]